MLQFATKKCSLQNHAGVTKSHFCDLQTVANGFIGNTAVTLRGTLPTFSIAEFSVLLYVQYNNNDKCIPRDIRFKSQEHLKTLGAAVEIVSLHTDLHRHNSSNREFALHFQDTAYNPRCGSNTAGRKYFAYKNEVAVGAICLRLYMCSILFGNSPHETYIAAVISRCPSCQVTLQYNPLGFNALT